MSPFPFVVRENQHEHDPELGLLAPVPSAAGSDTVHVDPTDGDCPLTFHCTSVTLRIASGDRVLQARDLRVVTTLTDGRVIFACSRFDKGGGWFGGLGAIALNAGSMALAARRRRGKTLVGHLRYPWISAVYAQNRSGMLSSEQLRIFFVDDGVRMQLDLGLPKDVDATAVATEMIRRTAAFRLGHEPELSDGQRAELAELAELAPLVEVPGDKQMVGRRFSTSWPATETSARFGMTTPTTDAPLVVLR